MIHIVIGQAGGGKTTFVRNQFIHGPLQTFEVDGGVPYTKCARTALIGKYGNGRRNQGADTLRWDVKEYLKETIRFLVDAGYDDIVMEGDAVNSEYLFEYVRDLGVPAKIWLVRCSVLTSIERLRNAGSRMALQFIRRTKTRARHNFEKYGPYFETEIIDTEDRT